MKYPNRWKALSHSGEEVTGYPVPQAIDVSYTAEEPPYYRTDTQYVWYMYVCDRDYRNVAISGFGNTYYENKVVPIDCSTLKELTENDN